jgi:predicted component of type VI protein secretion system
LFLSAVVAKWRQPGLDGWRQIWAASDESVTRASRCSQGKQNTEQKESGRTEKEEEESESERATQGKKERWGR